MVRTMQHQRVFSFCVELPNGDIANDVVFGFRTAIYKPKVGLSKPFFFLHLERGMVVGATLGRFGCPPRLPIREKVVPNVTRISIYAAPDAQIVLYSPIELPLSLLSHSRETKAK